jgi:hypothetical protein
MASKYDDDDPGYADSKYSDDGGADSKYSGRGGAETKGGSGDIGAVLPPIVQVLSRSGDHGETPRCTSHSLSLSLPASIFLFAHLIGAVSVRRRRLRTT